MPFPASAVLEHRQEDAFQLPPEPVVTGLPVAGYKKTQPQWAIDLVNQNKVLEEKILRQIDRHKVFDTDLDQRSVAEARTCVQTAFMWLNRAVFQPERLNGDLPDV